MTRPEDRRDLHLRGPSRAGSLVLPAVLAAFFAVSLAFAGVASAHSGSSDRGSSHQGQQHNSYQQSGYYGYQGSNPQYKPSNQPTDSGQTKTVSWVMADASGSASHITYPQYELSPKHNPSAPTCGHTIQTDVYKYGTSQDKQTVDGLVNGGVLNSGGDSSVVQSWSFTKQPDCMTTPPATPTPPTHTKTPCPPTKTHTPPPTKTTTPPPPPTTSTTPVPPPSTTTTTTAPPPPPQSTTPPPTHTVSTTPPPPPPTHTESTTPVPPPTITPPPGNTGDSAQSSGSGTYGILVAIAAALMVAGGAYTLSRRYGRRPI